MGALGGGGSLGWLMGTLIDEPGHGSGLMPLLVGVPLGAGLTVVVSAWSLRGAQPRLRSQIGLAGLAVALVVLLVVLALVQSEQLSW